MEVLETAVLQRVCAMKSLVCEAGLFQDTPGGRVASQVMGEDAIQPELVESVPDHSYGSLRCVPAPPERKADPVAQLGARVFEIESKADRPDENA